jgi:hypothetical protein
MPWEDKIEGKSEALTLKKKWHLFDGNMPHCTLPYKGTRYDGFDGIHLCCNLMTVSYLQVHAHLLHPALAPQDRQREPDISY